MIQTVAVALLLGIGHDSAQCVRIQEPLFPAGKQGILEPEPGINITDDLGLAPELCIQQRQLFLPGSGAVDDGGVDHALVEGRRSFRQRHGIALIQRPVAVDAAVVEGMAQLMGQRTDRCQISAEIGQDPAAAHAANTGAESAVPFAAAGVKIDPGLSESSIHHLRHFPVKSTEDLQQHIPCLFCGIGTACLAHRCQQVIPGQTALVTQQLCLRLQVLPEFRQIAVDGCEHGIQCLTGHICIFQTVFQRRRVAAELTLGNRLQLDGIQRMGNGILDILVSA